MVTKKRATKASDAAPKRRVATPAEAAAICRPLCNPEQETFVVLSMSVRNHVLDVSVVAIGTANWVEVHPRDVFRAAIRANAAGIVVAHNHPSGDPTPSPEDDMLTRRLADAGKLLGIPIIDHVVLGDGARFASYGELRAPCLGLETVR